MQFLEQSTAVTLKIGPFLDDSDGNTIEDALTISQADVRLSKNGGDIAQKTEATSCTHDELGVYGCPVDATDTNTLGRLQLWVHESGALQVWHEYMVVPSNVWDSLFGADYLQVDVVQVEGSDATEQMGDAVWDEAMDANAPAACNTAREYMNVVAAALAGATADEEDWSAQDLGETKTRIAATLDDDGMRTSIDTLDGT